MLIPCKVSPGNFSDERVVEVETLAGRKWFFVHQSHVVDDSALRVRFIALQGTDAFVLFPADAAGCGTRRAWLSKAMCRLSPSRPAGA